MESIARAELSDLCDLGGLFSAVTAKPYKAFNAWIEYGVENNVEEMRKVLSEMKKTGALVSLWESTTNYHKIIVDYDENQQTISYFNTETNKQDDTHKKTVPLTDVITDKAFRLYKKSAFILFPTELMP